jgi:hypothetical protein
MSHAGGHWKGLAQTDLCAPSTAHDRFQAWMQAGVFLKLWQAGPEHFEELEGIDWTWYASKRARTKLPWGRRNTSTSPTSRGKSGSKRRRLSSEREMPVASATEEAKCHGMKRVQLPSDAIVLDLASPIHGSATASHESGSAPRMGRCCETRRKTKPKNAAMGRKFCPLETGRTAYPRTGVSCKRRTSAAR